MCLNKFKEKYPEYNHISDEWFTWFIGFFEGDGCFMIGSKNLELIITQREDNKVILEEIQKTLNIGKVIIQTKHIVPGRYWIYRFIVRDYIGIGILLDLFKRNGFTVVDNLKLRDRRSKGGMIVKQCLLVLRKW